MSDQLSYASEKIPADVVAGLQAELNVLRQELEHSNRLATLGLLAAGVAHEINNILTPVLAYAQLASTNQQDSAFQAKALQKAIHGVETASQIAQAMLGFAGKPIEPAVANIQDTLQAALDCIGITPQKDRIQFDIDIHPNATVRMRPLALQQVLMNLLLNAQSALKHSRGMIRISADAGADGDMAISLSDSGPGIPSHLIERIFDPFVRASNLDAGRRSNSKSGSCKKSGTGLGLSICRRLIEEAGGTINVESVPGRGTKFTITVQSATAQRAAG